MIKEKYLYITFFTSAEAMATEQVCMSNNISGKLVPVPRELSANCGISWQSRAEDEERLKQLLKENDIEWEVMKVL